MTLSAGEKEQRQRERLLSTAAKYQTSTYCRRFVAPLFQKMIRAECGAVIDGPVTAIVDGAVASVKRYRGECVCVTCGKARAWNAGIKEMHTGHFIASRRNSVLLEEDNVAPQCSYCNYYENGAPQAFRLWMIVMRGKEVVDRLQRLKTKSVSFGVEELVDRRIEYAKRLKAAERTMATSR